jgi:hypothetical protein
VRTSRLGVAVVAIFVAVAACSRDVPRCRADEVAGCTCADGKLGYAACLEDGSGFGACASCTAPPPDASSGNAHLPLYAACSADGDCESGLCYTYTAKGAHCTHPCNSDDDCAPPSPQCTPKGVCKLP